MAVGCSIWKILRRPTIQLPSRLILRRWSKLKQLSLTWANCAYKVPLALYRYNSQRNKVQSQSIFIDKQHNKVQAIALFSLLHLLRCLITVLQGRLVQYVLRCCSSSNQIQRIQILNFFSKFVLNFFSEQNGIFFKLATALFQNRLQDSQIAINIGEKSREADVVNFAIKSWQWLALQILQGTVKRFVLKLFLEWL